jgi:PKD repeat protein
MQLVEALPPPNDDCAAAQSIAVGVAGTCPSNQVTGNTLAALEEAIPDPVCNSGNISDVWYTFNSGVANELEVNLEYLSATMVGVELYTTCGALVSGSCILDAGAVSPITYAVTPYTQYRLRCFTNYDNQNPGTFRLCVQHKPQPPLNDNICGAFNIAVSSSSTSETNGDNFYATQSPQAAMSCQTNHSRDVWYRATVPSSGVVTVNTNYGTALDLVGAMYTSSDNTCTGTLTQVACDDDRGPLDAAWMQVNNLTPGSTVFIRIAGFGAFPASTNKGTFKINVTEGLVWTGASDNTFNTISDPDLGIPTNWYSYDGGSYGPNNFSNAAVSIIIPLTAVNQPSAVGVVNCNSVRAVGNVFNVGGITAQAGATVNIHGNMSTNTLGTPRFTGAGQFRFNSTVATTHNILNNVRFFTTVTVAPTSTVAAGGKMIFEDNSSLFADSPAATYGAVTGSIKYRRTGNPSQYAYNYWSSPVQSATISSLIAPGVNPNTYQYETSNSTGVDYDGTQAGWLAVTPASVMQSGRGYIATGAGTATFTGVPTQSDVTYTATTGGGNFFNLVGNPFPAQLNAALFLSNNSGKITGGSIYVWDDDATGGVDYTAGDYIVSNGSITLNGPNSGAPFSGSIGACQGFFINWSGSGATINFNRSARILTGTNSEFFEATDYARLKLRIENNNEQSSETALLFAADATDAADVNYDAVRLPGNPALGVYTFIAGGEYVIQGLPELSTERIIPIGVVNTVAGPASIQMNQFEFFEEGVFVYLEDMQEGVFHNLANGPYAYTNTSITSNDPIRFRLHLKAPLAVSVTAACAGQSSGKMIVNNPNQTAVTVNLKDAQNNTIATTGAFLGERVIENLTTGAYVLDFAYDNGDNATKAVQVGTGSIVAPASFVSSSTSVSIEDAIIEFQASAAGATEYVWNFGDGTTVSNDLNPVHAYMAPGVYTVTFTASNGGCESVATSVVSVSANTTGISSVENANGFTIYPNPAKNTANLLLNLDRSETQVKVSIHDAAGRLVKTQNVNNVRAGSIVELGINGLASGLYQVTVEGNSFRNVSRLTISK